MQEWMRQAQNGVKGGILNFGAAETALHTTGGINYLTSTTGSQVYAASSLVAGR